MEEKWERYANDLPTVCDCDRSLRDAGSTSTIYLSLGEQPMTAVYYIWDGALGAFSQIWQYIKMDDSMPFYPELQYHLHLNQESLPRGDSRDKYT
ncbi:MAG: hypothetical protein ACLSGB_16210 [Dorea sp.]